MPNDSWRRCEVMKNAPLFTFVDNAAARSFPRRWSCYPISPCMTYRQGRLGSEEPERLRASVWTPSQPCLPESCPDVSATFTTIAFDDSSLRWLAFAKDVAQVTDGELAIRIYPNASLFPGLRDQKRGAGRAGANLITLRSSLLQKCNPR
jgi:hypothetical protein